MASQPFVLDLQDMLKAAKDGRKKEKKGKKGDKKVRWERIAFCLV